MGVRVSIDIAAPAARVWKHASDLESHHEWMADAESIQFVSDSRRGLGTTMEVLTRVGPLRTTDVMEVVRWEEPVLIEVRHEGVVTGQGRFEITSLGKNLTRFSWTEELEMPWYFGGRLGNPVSGWILGRIWRGNLARFKLRVEREQGAN